MHSWLRRRALAGKPLPQVDSLSERERETETEGGREHGQMRLEALYLCLSLKLSLNLSPNLNLYLSLSLDTHPPLLRCNNACPSAVTALHIHLQLLRVIAPQ